MVGFELGVIITLGLLEKYLLIVSAVFATVAAAITTRRICMILRRFQ